MLVKYTPKNYHSNSRSPTPYMSSRRIKVINLAIEMMMMLPKDIGGKTCLKVQIPCKISTNPWTFII